MSAYSLAHLPDPVLLRNLAALVARERATTAALLAHLAEVDARRLYLPAAHPSMFSYCVHALGLSQEAACKRIHAARTARRFPALFPALADGRLHLSAVILLAPHLTADNVEEVLAAAAGKTKAELERLLAERCPRPDLPARVEAIPPPSSSPPTPLLPGDQHAPGRVEAPLPPPRVVPLSPQRYALQFTLDQEAYDDLRYVQALLGHQVPAGDLAQVFGRALKALAHKLEKTRFAATPRPRRSQRPSPNPRHLPAAVKRAVWQRDGGQCTFLSGAGQRCPARTRLEYDHVVPVARGGQATVAGIRLHCRSHNQYAAACAFGADFVRHQREAARQEAAARQQAAAEVIPWLRQLGFRADEARAAAVRCERMPQAPLEERVRVALAFFSKPSHCRVAKLQPTPT